MKKITLQGGNKLQGKVSVGGSKNAALPILFACILTKGVSRIRNLPDIGDVGVALELLESFGATVHKRNGVTYIDTTDISYVKPDDGLVSKIRASTYLLGACLGRFGVCHLLSFGGCNFASRPIDMHIDAFLSLGCVLREDMLIADKPCGAEIDFKKASVGATVNAILLASRTEGLSVIRGGAREPHIDSLISFLISCGVNIYRRGDDLCIIGGELHGGEVTVIGDMIEAGTYLVAGLITGGDVEVVNCPIDDMSAIFTALTDLGAEITVNEKSVRASLKGRGSAINVVAAPYPGFPTDLQPIFASLMAGFKGGTITDTVWPTRFGYLDALSKFGAESCVDGNRAIIKSSGIRCGAVIAPDLRGGMACLLIALLSEEKSEIYSAEIILRGYEMLEQKLSALGANILIEEM